MRNIRDHSPISCDTQRDKKCAYYVAPIQRNAARQLRVEECRREESVNTPQKLAFQQSLNYLAEVHLIVPLVEFFPSRLGPKCGVSALIAS